MGRLQGTLWLPCLCKAAACCTEPLQRQHLHLLICTRVQGVRTLQAHCGLCACRSNVLRHVLADGATAATFVTGCAAQDVRRLQGALWSARLRGPAFCCTYLPGAAHCLAVGGEASRVHLFDTGCAAGTSATVWLKALYRVIHYHM